MPFYSLVSIGEREKLLMGDETKAAQRRFETTIAEIEDLRSDLSLSTARLHNLSLDLASSRREAQMTTIKYSEVWENLFVFDVRTDAR
jgi:hypothetical protein